MMISERKLRNWRKEALVIRTEAAQDEMFVLTQPTVISWADRLLELTRELLDQALVKKEG